MALHKPPDPKEESNLHIPTAQYHSGSDKGGNMRKHSILVNADAALSNPHAWGHAPQLDMAPAPAKGGNVRKRSPLCW